MAFPPEDFETLDTFAVRFFDFGFGSALFHNVDGRIGGMPWTDEDASEWPGTKKEGVKSSLPLLILLHPVAPLQ